MFRSILLGILLTLATTGPLAAQDVSLFFPISSTPATSRNSSVMNFFGLEMNVGLDDEQAAEIMRVLEVVRQKTKANRVIRLLADFECRESNAGEAPIDFNAPTDQAPARRENDLRPMPRERYGRVEILVRVASQLSWEA